LPSPTSSARMQPPCCMRPSAKTTASTWCGLGSMRPLLCAAAWRRASEARRRPRSCSANRRRCTGCVIGTGATVPNRRGRTKRKASAVRAILRGYPADERRDIGRDRRGVLASGCAEGAGLSGWICQLGLSGHGAFVLGRGHQDRGPGGGRL
jgi:hypothetical protein